jgi:ElaB/YqjD/DUF883 family membrane-anchored ribosome-binding protein
MQVTAGVDMLNHVADSARIAAENLEQQAPRLAGLVRSVADRAEEFSRDLRGQTVEHLVRTASDFTRKQPALAALAVAAAVGIALQRRTQQEIGNFRINFRPTVRGETV